MSNPNYPRQFTAMKNKVGPRKVNVFGYLRSGATDQASGQAIHRDFFRLDTQIDGYVERFVELYGEEPNNIPIYFPTSNREIVAIHQEESWNEKRRYGYGDGENYMCWNPVLKDLELCKKGSPLYKTIKYKWVEYLTLRFYIPNFPEGFFSIKTAGANSSIPNILQQLKLTELTMGEGFDHQLFYLSVNLSKQSTTPDSRAKYSVLKLRSAYSPEQKLLIQRAFTEGIIKRSDLNSYLQIEEYLKAEGNPVNHPQKQIGE